MGLIVIEPFRPLRLGLLLAGAAFVGGCMSWGDTAYRPAIPSYAKLPFVDQVWTTTEALEKRRGNPWPRPLTLNDYKDTLRLTLVDVMQSLEAKNSQTWDNSMTTLLGTTGAALGALAGRIGLTNTGIGVAAGGQIAQNHYTPDVERNQHLAAHRKLACISTEIGVLSEFQRRWAMVSASEDGRKAAAEALYDVSHAVDGVLSDYRQVLLGMSPPVETPQDMIRFLEAYKAQAIKADQAASAASAAAAPMPAASGASAAARSVDPTPTTGIDPAAAAAAAAATASASSNAASAALPASESASAAHGVFGTIKMPDDPTITPHEYAEYVAAGNRYAVRFIALSTRLEACRRLGAP